MNLVRGGTSASPASLFAGGEQGVWYDPSDLSTLFQDSAGTTPVTAAGQTVGKMLDKSGCGNHATQATLAQRPTYQIDSSDRPYLLFDGVDDGMVTSTITAPGVDKAQVFTGLRKLSNAASGVPFELGNASNGGIALFAPFGAANNYSLRSRGTISVDVASLGYTPPITNVVTGLGDISGDRATLRVNGAQVAQSTSDQGTGNYLAYPFYIGRRGGTTLPFNGRIYSLITRFGPNLTDGQITSTESWVNGKTGAY